MTKYYLFGDQRVAMRRGSVVYYLHGDHLGSTSLTTDQSGAVIAETRYLPYGQERWSDGTQPTDFGFTSQRNDSDMELIDYGARWYDHYLNHFISPDTPAPAYLVRMAITKLFKPGTPYPPDHQNQDYQRGQQDQSGVTRNEFPASYDKRARSALAAMSPVQFSI